METRVIICLTSDDSVRSVGCMVVDVEPRAKTPARPRSTVRALWSSTIGKKTVMAVTGLVLVLFLLAHMLGNLKVFFGPADFDGYAAWLRTIGQPVLHESWYLWIQRAVLLFAVVTHATAAAQLSRRDRKARPVRYAHGQRPKAT